MPERFPTRQNGAALVVGLVMLLVLTLLAVSTMRTAALELLMASNTKYRENAFRLAEAGIADAVGQLGAAGALNPATGWTANLIPGAIGDLEGDYEISVSYLDEGEVFSGYSASEFQFFHYQIDSTGSTQQRGANSAQSQGLVQVGGRSAE